MSNLSQPPSRWLAWKPQAANISKSAQGGPSKPTELSTEILGLSGLMASIEEQSEFHCEHSEALTSGDEKGENPRLLAGRSVKEVYFQDAYEAWFQDIDGRFWHLDFATNTTTELKPKVADVEESIPPEVWNAFGTLLGILLLRKEGAPKRAKYGQSHDGNY
jgi:hypothetical protein